MALDDYDDAVDVDDDDDDCDEDSTRLYELCNLRRPGNT